MAAQNAPRRIGFSSSAQRPGVTSSSKIRRDLRLSLAILAAGIVLEALYGIAYWSGWTGNYPYSSTPTVVDAAITVATESIGFVLIVVGAIFTGKNWSLLRKSRRDA